MSLTTPLKNLFTLGLLAFAFMISGRSGAQTPGTGAISGTVSDSNDRKIASADIVAVDQANGTTRKVETSEAGLFRFALLPPGVYDLKVARDGFSAKTLASILVTVGQTSSLNVILSVAGAHETCSGRWLLYLGHRRLHSRRTCKQSRNSIIAPLEQKLHADIRTFTWSDRRPAQCNRVGKWHAKRHVKRSYADIEQYPVQRDRCQQSGRELGSACPIV